MQYICMSYLDLRGVFDSRVESRHHVHGELGEELTKVCSQVGQEKCKVCSVRVWSLPEPQRARPTTSFERSLANGNPHPTPCISSQKLWASQK